MNNIQQVHQDIYEFLIEKHREDTSFKFTTRITNRYGRLDNGYWFHGNDSYLVVSFWDGTDWRNRTPNIMFSLTEEECYLEIAVSDSENKRTFVDKYLKNEIDDLLSGYKYYKHYADNPFENKKYLGLLSAFLKEDKSKIDRIVAEYSDFLATDSNKIGFINDQLFVTWTNKIEHYKTFFDSNKDKFKHIEPIIATDEHIDREELKLNEPFILRRILIRKFPGVKQPIEIVIPKGNRFVFLTGENGTGKSTILKAISCALLNDHQRLIFEDVYDVELHLEKYGNDHIVYFHNNNENKFPGLVGADGFTAYGPGRLMIVESTDAVGSPPDFSGSTNSLYTLGIPLIGLEHGLKEWKESSAETIEIRQKIISQVIRDIIPGFRFIEWAKRNAIGAIVKPTKYGIFYGKNKVELELDSEALDVDSDETIHKQTELLTFDQMASGAKSVLAMIGDMLVRLFHQHKNINDIAELTGIVLIDEIDLHLHPTFQLLFVKQLMACFPRIQFIVTTHSPIPLLGSSEQTVLLKVDRTYEKGTVVDRLTGLEKQVRQLLPDTILTSTIFDFGYLETLTDRQFDELSLQSNYNQIQRMQQVDERLNKLDKNIFPDELFNN